MSIRINDLWDYDIDAYLICIHDKEKMIAIGEEIVDNWDSIYVYECPKCHHIIRTFKKYQKSFQNSKPKVKVKVLLI